MIAHSCAHGETVTKLGVIDRFSIVSNINKLENFQSFSRSLKYGNEIGGHIVSGHVHGKA